MNIHRRHLAEAVPVLGLLAIGLLKPVAARADSPEENTVAQRLTAFRAAQFAHDAKTLESLCWAELSYSHSDAHIEDRATFIKNATSAGSKYNSLDYKDPWIRVAGDAAIVRFHWMAESETIPGGKKNATNLHILMVWQKRDGVWKLLARGATKP
jgi:ketosteroid isomerase-like protein